jgi:2-amino-4-hydroxy-6-hydroxymethyldihydropteridine diphosphokinase
MTDTQAVVYLGLGANLGDRAANIREALEQLGDQVGVERVSSLYETAPVGYSEQSDFLNAVCKGTTALSPEELFNFVKDIERAMGRTVGFRNGPRLIDIDILLYDDRVLETKRLVIPHVAMHERAFVLVPLAEIDPEVAHPALDVTVRELLTRAQGVEDVVMIGALGSSPDLC